MAANDYQIRIVRVDLTQGTVSRETLGGEDARRYVGGAALGARLLYDGVPPTADWRAPENRLIIGSGPLGGTAVPGSGSFNVVAKGALTEGAASTQANGYFGAYLRSSGIDTLVIEGAAHSLCYLYIEDGDVEIVDADELTNKDTWETYEILHEHLARPGRDVSVLSIGPAGENLVRFAGVFSDRGHAAAHNGVGAVMGAKRLKAIVAAEGRVGVPLHDARGLLSEAEALLRHIVDGPRADAGIYRWGTLNDFVHGAQGGGWLPVRNYSTNIFPIDDERLEAFSGPSIHANWAPQRHPCFACPMHHCHILRVPGGPMAGREVEEPEYEGLAACGSVIGNTDATACLALATEIDRLGFDINETGWLLGLVMECYERGVITKADTEGLEMTWGNASAAWSLLHRIANREGFGDVLAEGTMRAARAIGGEAPNYAVHTLKGSTPRGHDHRAIWSEMFDTCTSNTGTLETGLGVAGGGNPFSPRDVAQSCARRKGAMLFQDSLGACRFTVGLSFNSLVTMVNAATGWDMTPTEAATVGRRAANLFRAFNCRAGLGPEIDRPSPRYGSAPTDGPLQGFGVMPYWDDMLATYYREMGWQVTTARPLVETLHGLGLDDVAADLWPA